MVSMGVRLLRRLLIAGLLLTPLAATCLGDSAPVAAIGTAAQPLDSTTVRLAEERIEIHVSRKEDTGIGISRSGRGEYQIWFRFEPEADEQMLVGFPLWFYDPGGQVHGARLEDLRVEIDGREVDVHYRPSAYEEPDREGGPRNWAVFPVTFRAGQPLEMVVWYTIGVYPYGGDRSGSDPLWISYVLRTGAHWAGAIGRAEAVLTMDRPIRPEDIRVEEHRGITTTPGWNLEDGVLRWVWEDVEPDFDLHVVLENVYWLDAAREIEALLEAADGDREMITEAWWKTLDLVYSGGPPLRGGIEPADAAADLMPALLGAGTSLLQDRPGDVFVSGWRPWLLPGLAGRAWSGEAQEAIASFLAAAMPASFGSEAEAREWVAANAADALTAGQVDALLGQALGRVRQEEVPGSGNATPGAEEGPGAAAPSGTEEGPGRTVPSRADEQPGNGTGLIGLIIALGLLLGAGAVGWRRRRAGRPEATER